MTSIEDRVAVLEAKVQQLEKEKTPSRPWYENPSPAQTDEQIEAFKEMEAFGKYWRKTERMPPEGWKPGDPIPEPDWDEE